MNWPARIALSVATSILATLAQGALMSSPALADSGCPSASGAYGGGAGTSGNPYVVSAPGHLQRLRDTSADYSKYFIFTSDIDMGGCVWSSPIANGISTFTGRLDGDGHVITGLSVTEVNPAMPYVGLVGYLGTNGTIQDLGFTGNVSLTHSGSGSTYYVGGLVGFTFAPTTVSGSYTTGNVTATVSSSSANVSIFEGGLVGYSQSTVTNSFARGNITLSGTSTAGAGSSVNLTAGGAIGNLGLGTVTNVYSTGSVTSSGSATTVTRWDGGFAGNRDSYPTLTALYWDTTTSGLSSAAGHGSSANMTGASTIQMQSASTFSSAGWSLTSGYDASSTWGICSSVNGGYPFLTSFYSATPCVSNADPAQTPPSWFQSTGRADSSVACDAGWSPSWAQWMNAGQGGFVCNREIYFDIQTNGWSAR